MRSPSASSDFAVAAPLVDVPADAGALSVRPTDFGAWQGPLVAEAAAGKAKALTIAVLAHVLIGAGVFGWRDSGGFAAPGEDEIPVEIVVERGAAGPQTPVSPEAPAEASPAPRPNETRSAEAKIEPAPEAMPAPPEQAPPPVAGDRAEERTAVAVAVAVAPAPVAADVAAPPVRQKPFAETEAQRRAEDAARHRHEEQARERRIERERQAHARQIEREAAARERRMEARRAADAERQERAAQDRRRVASLAPSQGAGMSRGDAFDAAAYRQIVARAVSAAVARACPHAGGGRVVVALTIGGAGQIAAASLSSSSGDGALDSAAVSAVRRAGPFPAPVGRSSVSVPVAVTCK